MISNALSKFVLYWKPPGHPQYGRRWVTWSMDSENDRKKNNNWPAIQRYARELERKFAGKFTSIQVYDRETDQKILEIDKHGEWHYR